jgi:type II secretory pathway component PulF
MNDMYKKIIKKIREYIRIYITERISLRQSIYISKRISFLLEAGVSLPKAFSIIAGQMKKRGIVLTRISVAISQGQATGDVIYKAGIFGASALPMIKIGEESGTLAESFSALSDELEKRAMLSQKIIGAILYPACITVGMLILVIVLMTVVFPKMLGVFESLHVALPLSTRILMWLSDFLRRFGILLGIIGVLGFTACMVSYKRSNRFHLKVDRAMLRIPLVSVLVRAYVLASISNVIGLLLTNNSSLLTALRVAEQTCGNLAYREILKNITVQISGGASLGKSLGGYPAYFPQEYCDLVGIGEQTGKLSETFTYAHTLYARDLDMLTKSLSASIEPILMVGIGLAIGVIAFSIVTPMYSITSHLHGS